MKESIISKTSEYFKKKGIILPKISELCDPSTINENIISKLKTVNNEAFFTDLLVFLLVLSFLVQK